MARLRDSWRLSLSAPPILRNPKRLFQPETVSYLDVTRRVAAEEQLVSRKEIEAQLRASEARQAFLLKLLDALRPLSDPIAIQAEAARLLGEYLGSGRAYYVEV